MGLPEAAELPPRPVPLATIRAWAREAGFEVADFGRLRPDVLAAYEAAHLAD